MKNIRWIALVLALVMLMTGCSGMSFQDLMGEVASQTITPFSEMQYTRPDMDKMQAELETCCSMADTERDKEKLIDQTWVVYNLYNTFYTQYNLASIYYFRDMTDSYWEAEYNYCMQNASNAEAMLEEMFYALAACPLKEELEKDEAFGEGFFDGYQGESVWDEAFLSLIEQETALKEEYFALCTQAQAVESYTDEYFEQYGTKMAEVFVKLVKVRKNLAKQAGYKDYADFAYDFYHYRDYTPQQAQQYLQEIRDELVPLYRQVEGRGGVATPYNICTQEDIFSYVKNCAEAMGGTVKNAFKAMSTKGLYDLTYSDKKYDGSFEVYLTDYYAPYVFVNPSGTQQDKLTFVHEFGHFCNDYASYGSYAGVDVAEFFSQGLEYLSLFYGEEAGVLEEMKLVDCLRIYVDQAAYAFFEHKVYQLKDAELTVEKVYELYDQIGTQFGFDSWGWDKRDFVAIGHFFTDPMYVVSYVVSNDAAFQLYQMQREDFGSGLELYERELATEQTYFLSFVEEAGLESPFAEGRMAKVRKTLEKVLG